MSTSHGNWFCIGLLLQWRRDMDGEAWNQPHDHLRPLRLQHMLDTHRLHTFNDVRYCNYRTIIIYRYLQYFNIHQYISIFKCVTLSWATKDPPSTAHSEVPKSYLGDVRLCWDSECGVTSVTWWLWYRAKQRKRSKKAFFCLLETSILDFSEHFSSLKAKGVVRLRWWPVIALWYYALCLDVFGLYIPVLFASAWQRLKDVAKRSFWNGFFLAHSDLGSTWTWRNVFVTRQAKPPVPKVRCN